MKKFGLSVIALVLSLAFANFASAAENAMVRIFHASPDAPAVDVYVNGDAVVEGAEFKDATDYLELPAGKHMVEIYPAGDMSNAVISTELEVMAGQAYTVAAINDLANLELSVTTDTMMVEEGKTKVRVGHFSPDAPTVDVGLIGGDALFSGANFKDVTDYSELDAGTYDLEIRTTDGTQVLDLSGTTLNANTVYSVYAVNTASNLEVVVLTDATMMPSEMPQTGMGGTANSATSNLWVYALIGGVAITSIIGLRRFQKNN